MINDNAYKKRSKDRVSTVVELFDAAILPKAIKKIGK